VCYDVTPRKALTLLLLVCLAVPATALAMSLRSHRMPSGAETAGVPEVGALYPSSHSAAHGCTATVVSSPRGNTLITAAHCIAGSGAGMIFVPGQDGTRAPYGRWRVTAAHLEPRWLARQDPHADLAFLTVAPMTLFGQQREIQQVTGAYTLGATAGSGQRVRVIGYPAGTTDDAIQCTTTVYLTRGYPSFDCRGYVSGTSGAPWVRVTRRATQIVGVIGGLNQGGCHDYTSYSSPLDVDARAAYRRAEDHAAQDIAPPARGDGC
jgi:V8-like Glu-specific endopeptidase